MFNEGLFALCLERFALWGLHSDLSGIAGVFGPVQAFVLFRESWPAGLNAPPLGAPLVLEAMPKEAGEASADFGMRSGLSVTTLRTATKFLQADQCQNWHKAKEKGH